MSKAFQHSSDCLNLAAFCPATRALGPGWRAAVWVQGCPFRCKGCLVPAWLPFVEARKWPPEELATEVLKDPRIEGLTISGGEPFLQARALARFVAAARKIRELNVICFTGFMLEDLQNGAACHAAELLQEADVLIDGPYVAELNDGKGLRGSSNQRVHFLGPRLSASVFDFTSAPRLVEVHVRDREILVAGVPPRDFHEQIMETLSHVRKYTGTAVKNNEELIP